MFSCQIIFFSLEDHSGILSKQQNIKNGKLPKSAPFQHEKSPKYEITNQDGESLGALSAHEINRKVYLQQQLDRMKGK